MGPTLKSVQAVALQTVKPDRNALIVDHEAAARFHEAIAEALEAQDEIERDPACDPYWREKYAKWLGNAAVALQKMPAKWAALLSMEMPGR